MINNEDVSRPRKLARRNGAPQPIAAKRSAHWSRQPGNWFNVKGNSYVSPLGISILQQTPPDAKARSTKPPNSCGMRSRMTLTPYLQLGEAPTAGPPNLAPHNRTVRS